jgi:nucleoside-diphosphate-sugar epimerase
MKALFIGGTGLISTAVTELAAQRGIELYLLNRGQRPADIPAGVKVIHADIRKPEEAAAALAGHTWDCVVDWIAFTVDHVETDIRLFAGKTGQCIFISSASAYQKPLSHYLITESTPLANPYWEYSRNKIACEERLMREYRERAFPAVVVRPSLTYGPTMIPHAMHSWSHPWTMVDRMLKGRPIISHGDGTSLWVTTHNTDFAKAFVGLMGHQQATGHAFHITTDEVLTWDQIYQTVGHAVGVEPKIAHIPTDFICAMDPSMVGGLWGDKSWSVVFDNTKIKRFVPDFVATTTLIEGVRKSIAYFKADPRRQSIDEKDNQNADRIIAAYEAALGRDK